MNHVDLNKILDREKMTTSIINFLHTFEEKKTDISIQRGVFIYGPAGSGKTYYVLDLLKSLNYDVILYDAGDMRNKNIIDMITKHNMSDTNVISLFKKQTKKIVIVMDEIDGMNNGDKGGINSLIKMIRPKKTKKQKQEEIALIPIICIGNYQMDKKMKELMKICLSLEIKMPTNTQMTVLIKSILTTINDTLLQKIVEFVEGDIRKFKIILDIYNSNNGVLTENLMENILDNKTYNEDAKQITKKIINNNYEIDKHNILMNETERTIVALLWHENIVDLIQKSNKNDMINLYIKILDNICFADYIDRITFQKQIWQFNEMSSLIKTFYNNKIFHNEYKKQINFNPTEVRFTKVLTKYSTEYNNNVFIQSLCQELMLDKKDMLAYLLHLRMNETDEYIQKLFENNNIGKLDISRIYRYIDSYTKACGEINEHDEIFNEIPE